MLSGLSMSTSVCFVLLAPRQGDSSWQDSRVATQAVDGAQDCHCHTHGSQVSQEEEQSYSCGKVRHSHKYRRDDCSD